MIFNLYPSYQHHADLQINTNLWQNVVFPLYTNCIEWFIIALHIILIHNYIILFNLNIWQVMIIKIDICYIVFNKIQIIKHQRILRFVVITTDDIFIEIDIISLMQNQYVLVLMRETNWWYMNCFKHNKMEYNITTFWCW